ncbi:MAG: hypothetical protein JWN25_2313 [Verrucomicrobiales bacterium]|jgi:hypothetical protein|nr:hypothetical protein [Verrucomicrobiales bacterium]MDB6129265.1 hypothetical protein [Verrucomicrobiales bacterium]
MPLLVTFKRLHLFLGCFFAPLLTFFIVTGWYQAVYHNRQKGVGDAERFIDKLTSVHVDQIYPSKTAIAYSDKMFKGLVVVMAIALLVTIILGVILAFKFTPPKRKWQVWISLSLGIALPILLLYLGQKRM